MTKKYGLGKGLDALIPTRESQLPESGITQIPTEDILPNPRQPRARFDPEEISDLAASIREHGVIQPLIVTHTPQPGQFMLIAGERRLIAAREADLKTVPAILREASEQQLVELALVENVQRADLGPLETAEAYRQLAEDFNLSHDEIASRVGKNRVTITNTLRLLRLPEDVKRALVEDKISEGHARALLALPTEESQSAALHTVLKQELNVRQTEQLVRKLTGVKKSLPPRPAPAPEVLALEERLRQYLGTRVNLNHRRKGGTLVIHYYSEEELDSLVRLILGDSD
jgi:ParB family chromosome partitioning protein